MAQVVVLMGSKSDLPVVEKCKEFYEFFGISYELKIMSAHRNPNEVHEFATNAENNGVKVIVCCAGMAAHLAGVVSSLTTLPVLGVPLKGGVMEGLDALLSTVQMPAGVPVPTLAIGSAGTRNAAVVAAQILALNDPAIRGKLIEFKKMGCRL